jgi:transposase
VKNVKKNGISVFGISTQDFLKTLLAFDDTVFIEDVTLCNDKGILDVYLNFKRGQKFSCPACSAVEQSVHSTTLRTWRHENFPKYKCYIHMRVPRVNCTDCGVLTWTPPWASKNSGFTLAFEAYVLCLAREMPVSRIAALVEEHDTRIWRIIKRYVAQACAKKCFKKVTQIGLDETSSKRGHNYISIFGDAETKEVLFVTEGKKGDVVELFVNDFKKRNGDVTKITEATIDMSKAYISGVQNYLPNASITYDKFHVVQALNKAQDEVRRKEQADNPLLKKSRYLWLKNPENLTKKQMKHFETLRYKNLKTARVYQMKLTFQDIYREADNSESAATQIKKWLSWAVRSRLEPVKSFAQMVKNHLEGILRYFDTRLTTGFMESINSRIQEIKRRAKGFRNLDNFIAMIYLEAGNLDLPTIQINTK